MSAERERQGVDAAHTAPLRHWGGFLVSGGLAFAVDATVLEAGVRLLALDPLAARLLAITMAMLVGWLSHRRLTFGLRDAPTLAELGRYVTAAWAAATVNYAVFAVTLVLAPTQPRLAALVIASVAAMIFSYVSMRYTVFRDGRDGEAG
jgi:putative flippase GtrA